MTLIKETEQYIQNILTKLGYETKDVTLETCNIKSLGQFQLNIAMPLAKQYHDNPRTIAEKIVSQFDDRFCNVNIAGPGFINISLADHYILEFMNCVFDHFENYIDLGPKKKILIDYGGANAAKALHVGHMRSANIGEGLKRLARLLGHEVIGDVHLGDLGRQAGMIISELMIEQPELPFFDENFKGEYPKINLTTEDLGILYPKANIAAKNDEKRMEQVREITAEIERGNQAYTELWRQIVEISSKDIKKVYDELNCHFDLWEGELSSMKYVPSTMEVLEPYLYESEGAKVIDVAKEDDKKPLPPLLVIKTDGTTIYATRDLATLYQRVHQYHPDEIWYVVDDRQSTYFDQVFRASYKTGLVPDTTKLVHYGFGTINGKDGKPFKTRDGGIMLLSELIDLLKEAITQKVQNSNNQLDDETIQKITIATLKYTDLLSHRKTDYIFDLDGFSSLEGKTGPYILYSLVRIKSILKKVDRKVSQITHIPNEEVKQILLKLIELSKVLSGSYHDGSLHYITEYLYELCSEFNNFYAKYNIVNEQDEEVRDNYIATIDLVHQAIVHLLDVLAIEPVEKM